MQRQFHKSSSGGARPQGASIRGKPATTTPASQVDPVEILRRCHSTITAIEYYNGKGGTCLTPGFHPVSLVTFDDSGYPSARTIVPLEIAEDLSCFRFYTREDSRKVREIQNNPKVSLAWQDQRGQQGWLTVKGDAVLKPGNSPAFPVDIFVYAKMIEAVSYNENLLTDDGNGSIPISMQRVENVWKRIS